MAFPTFPGKTISKALPGAQAAGLQHFPGFLCTDFQFPGLMNRLIARHLVYSSSSSFLTFFFFLTISTFEEEGSIEDITVFLLSFFGFFGSRCL